MSRPNEPVSAAGRPERDVGWTGRFAWLLRAALGAALGLLVRLWLSTVRVHVVSHASLESMADKPWVFAHWHAQIMLLLAHRRRRSSVALVSLSPDGELMTAALRWFDVVAVRGSSSRGGRAGLANVVDWLRGGSRDAVLAVDGPKGPRQCAKPGALAAARRGDCVIVPYAAWCSRSWTLRGTWDKFEVPLPFSRIEVAMGEGMVLPAEQGAEELAELGAAIEATRKSAARVGNADETGARREWGRR